MNFVSPSSPSELIIRENAHERPKHCDLGSLSNQALLLFEENVKVKFKRHWISYLLSLLFFIYFLYSHIASLLIPKPIFSNLNLIYFCNPMQNFDKLQDYDFILTFLS